MYENIQNQIKDAMRARDTLRLNTLRGVLSAFTNESLNLKRKPQDKLSDIEAINVIRRLVKQRKDSIEQFQKGGRQDLVENESLELKILEEFLPVFISEEKIKEIALKVIGENPNENNSGKIIGIVMKLTAGDAEGGVVKRIVEELLKK